MKLNNRTAFLLLMFVLAVSEFAHSHGQDAYNAFAIENAAGVDGTVDEIIRRLENQGFVVLAVINHAAAAESVGLDLKPTQVVLFSAPRKDTRLIRASQSVAIDLPQKILVWEDSAGEIHLKYNAPGYLTDRHNFPVKRLLRHVERALGQFGDIDDGLVTIDSEQSVDATVATLQDVLMAAGFRIPVVIDHAEIARAIGKRLRPTVTIIFGNPKVGTQLIQNSREVALDLPQKFLVWEDLKGQVHITNNTPGFVGQRGGVQGLDNVLGNIANALANFANQGAMP